MFRISIKYDDSKARRQLAELDKAMRRAVPRALNRAAVSARAEATRAIRGEGYKLRAAVIKDQLGIQRATLQNPVARLEARYKAIPLLEYRARQTRKGVSVDVLRGRRTISSVFIAKMPSGHRGVFRRIGRKNRWELRHGKRVRTGLPIKELFGPSVADAFANPKVIQKLREHAMERFDVELRRELAFRASKA